MSHSTLSGNSVVGIGGGIHNQGQADFINSTISGNLASINGGGIYNIAGDLDPTDGTINLTNVTITSNTADSDNNGVGTGGGIYVVAADTRDANIKNTILAGNSDTGGPNPDCVGPLISQGYNLIQIVSASCSINGDTTGNLTDLNPNLGPLRGNGGPTFTHALLAGSPAINAGTNVGCPATDQRGINRPQEAICDMGAYEFLTSLAINYKSGRPGSFFTITGSDFPPTSTVTIAVNGHVLSSTVPADMYGNIVFLLSTDQADAGHYFVTGTANPSATTNFVLGPDEPLHPQEGSGSILNVPSGIAFTKIVYLPLIQR